ncbi:MAG: diaminopimelate epimerase [Syntrophorhabdales bacterium]|jgi:diaminopimelate epimerase
MGLLHFYKMSASGNDFIIIDDRDGAVRAMFPKLADFARKVCRRRHSVGADGLILIEKSDTLDFTWQFYNADGSVAEMCGNGGRCAARFAYLKGIAGERIAFGTLAGTVKAEVGPDCNVKLQLTKPAHLKLDHPIRLDTKEIFVSSVDTGVPHAVLLTDHIDMAPVEELGRMIRHHKAFSPKGTNVDFVQVIDRKHARIRTYERGVEGETYACGTGCVAAGVILQRKGLTGEIVNVLTRGGETVRVYVGDEVYLEGSARVIYEGTLWSEALD